MIVHAETIQNHLNNQSTQDYSMTLTFFFFFCQNFKNSHTVGYKNILTVWENEKQSQTNNYLVHYNLHFRNIEN